MLRKLIGITMVLALVLLGGVTPTLPAPAAPGEKPPEAIPLEMLPAETAEIIALREAIEAEVDAISARMFEINDWMYHNPETGYLEFECTKMTAAELEKHGFEVKFGVEGLEEGYNEVIEERFGAAGLPTAYLAKYKGKSEYPVIMYMTEHDALRAPEPFHGCQHNQQPPVALGAAIALSKVMEENNLPGSVWVVMCPAEEIPPPDKSAMAKAGLFDKVDFVFNSHGTSGRITKRAKAGVSNCCMLINSDLYDFYGQSCHGASAWAGRDALDAARMFFMGVDMLREHSRPEFRFMGAITKTGTAPNVIDNHVQVDHWIRNSDRAGQEAIDAKAEQVRQIARGAAMATFCEVKIRHYADYYNGISTAWGNALAFYYAKFYGDAEAISEELGTVGGGWDEAGYAGTNTPSIKIECAVAGIPKTVGHSPEAAAQTLLPTGHRELVLRAKSGAVMGMRLITEPELRANITDEHAQWLAYALAEGLITEDMIRDKWK